MLAQSLGANGVPPEELAAAQTEGTGGDAGVEQLAAELEAQLGPEGAEAALQVLQLAEQVGATPEETQAALAEVLEGGGEPLPEDAQVQAEYQSLVERYLKDICVGTNVRDYN
ncbi:hypothetical protein FACS1894170_06680 [Planctomycetales bacterium]|nr:hypothetical protein FACS1894170_06680 [Planctomycetales bacterium]